MSLYWIRLYLEPNPDGVYDKGGLLFGMAVIIASPYLPRYN